MTEIERLYAILKHNEELCTKFFEIESEILTTLNFQDFFSRLVSLIRHKLSIPYVWVSIIRGSEVSALLRDQTESKELAGRLNIVGRRKLLALLEGETSPILRNADLEPYSVLTPDGLSLPYKSLAIAPLSLDGRLIGSLNQADIDPARFTPEMDTGLLSQLAIKISLCLSNVTAHEKLRRLATRDPLTGLMNRRDLDDRLHSEFSRARRYAQPLSVAFLDLDDFKAINDRLGHEAGDLALNFFATNLQRMVRDTDICARYAGDEFVAILPNTTPDEAAALMRRIHAFFWTTHVPDTDSFARFSYGIASTADKGVGSHKILLREADSRLYEAKRHKTDQPEDDTQQAAGA